MSMKITTTSSGDRQVVAMQGTENDEDIPFPSLSDGPQPMTESEDWHGSVTSKLTSSDKLGALPLQLEGFRTGRTSRGSSPRIDSHSLPSLFSPSASPAALNTELAHVGPSRHATLSEGSLGKEASRHRVSFDSDRASPTPAPYPIARQALSALNRGSDPGRRDTPGGSQPATSHSPSTSRPNSRATSPLRLFQWPALHRSHPREEPFIPVDPFRREGFTREATQHELSTTSVGAGRCEYDCTDALPTHYCIPKPQNWGTGLALAQHTITIVVPRHLYITLFMLRLPSLYFSRVARLFEDAAVSKPDIQRMIDACTEHDHHDGPGGKANLADGLATHSGMPSAPGVAVGSAGQVLPVSVPLPGDWALPSVSPALSRFKYSWEVFISSLLKEWKTNNVVSALLLSAILTMFQIEPAASDPVTRTAGLLSLICALMSLIYGCMYIIRFSTMRTMYKAARWAEEARRTNTSLWWNVWVLLAMPVVWLAWSMILFIVAILSYVWRTGASNDPNPRPPVSPLAALGPRIAITVIFAVGLVYLGLIVRTLKSYGGSQAKPVRGRDPLWRIGSGESGLTGGGVVVEGAPDEEDRRGRQRERGSPRGGISRKDVQQAHTHARQVDANGRVASEQASSMKAAEAAAKEKQAVMSLPHKGVLRNPSSQESAASGSGLGTAEKY